MRYFPGMVFGLAACLWGLESPARADVKAGRQALLKAAPQGHAESRRRIAEVVGVRAHVEHPPQPVPRAHVPDGFRPGGHGRGPL